VGLRTQVPQYLRRSSRFHSDPTSPRSPSPVVCLLLWCGNSCSSLRSPSAYSAFIHWFFIFPCFLTHFSWVPSYSFPFSRDLSEHPRTIDKSDSVRVSASGASAAACATSESSVRLRTGEGKVFSSRLTPVRRFSHRRRICLSLLIAFAIWHTDRTAKARYATLAHAWHLAWQLSPVTSVISRCLFLKSNRRIIFRKMQIISFNW